MYRRIWSMAILIWLLATLGFIGGGCGEAGVQVESAGAPSVQGEALPGRLLFVRQGVIWLWRERQAIPFLGDGRAAHPAWSPDGQRIAYISREQSFSDLLLADAGGQAPTRLIDNSSSTPPNSLARVLASRWVFYPSWSPDGRKLAVAMQMHPPRGDPPVDPTLDLVLLPVGSGAPTPLYADGEASVGRSVFVDQGTALIFTRAGLDPGGHQILYRLDVSDRKARVFAGAPPGSYDPAVSPDGRWLVFAASVNGRTDLFCLPTGGGVPVQLTNIGTARAPAFAPNGRLLAFLAIAPGEAGFDLWVADIASDPAGLLLSGPPRRLTTGLKIDGDSGLSWAP